MPLAHANQFGRLVGTAIGRPQITILIRLNQVGAGVPDSPHQKNAKKIKKISSPQRTAYVVCVFNYSAFGAPTGQTPAQAPHSTQASASITYFPSPSEIAPTGHSPAQAPQLTQSSEIMYAIIKCTSVVFQGVFLLTPVNNIIADLLFEINTFLLDITN